MFIFSEFDINNMHEATEYLKETSKAVAINKSCASFTALYMILFCPNDNPVREAERGGVTVIITFFSP